MTPAAAEPGTLADVVSELGGIPVHRIIWRNIGNATEDDQLALCDRKLRVELVDGVLVHKGITRDVLDEVLASVAPGVETLADVLDRLGGVPLDRILWTPRPGTATGDDVLRLLDGEPKRLVELFDGILVEKPMGQREGFFAMVLGGFLLTHARSHRLGVVGAPDTVFRLKPGQDRLPDLCFTAWANLPSADAHLQRVGRYAPDLAVEILSDGNTAAEMARKRREYFAGGTKLVWIIDPDERTVGVYADPHQPDLMTLLRATDTLDGGAALPGFALPLADLFDDPQLNPRPTDLPPG
ncbi:MAG: Uma2 family endonuclease [Gemmataceae bacterium]|nr:Uma2 family endonuclease [Gemmataceae bacterium]